MGAWTGEVGTVLGGGGALARPPGPLRVYVRYLLFLAKEFRWPLLVFWGLVLSVGFVISRAEGLPYVEACYGVFLMVFLESALEFPKEWYLQVLFFLVPVIGLGAVAESLVRLAFLVFTRKQNLQEWQRMVATLYSDHIVVVGVGKVGVKIVRGLVELGELVVAIERDRESEFLEEIHALRVPVIHGEGRHSRTLEAAGVARARAIILATDDDLANLDAALTAQSLNPSIRVVLRLFDETLAEKVEGAFHMPAVSISRVAAPAFIAAATGREVYQTFRLGDEELDLVDLVVHPQGLLNGEDVGRVQSRFGVNIVMYKGAAGVRVNPEHEVRLQGGDALLVVARRDALRRLMEANRPQGAAARSEGEEGGSHQ